MPINISLVCFGLRHHLNNKTFDMLNRNINFWLFYVVIIGVNLYRFSSFSGGSSKITTFLFWKFI